MRIKTGENANADQFVLSLVAGEDIGAGEAVCVVPSAGVAAKTYSPSLTDTGTAYALTTTKWRAQAFTTSANARGIARLRVYISETSGGGNVAYRIRIRSSLTGSDLWTEKNENYGGNGWVEHTPNIALSPSTTYYVIVQADDGFDGDLVQWNGGTTSSYAAHSAWISSNSGGSWTENSGFDLSMEVKELVIVQGRAALASAVHDDARFQNFVGFAEASISAGATGLVSPQPLIASLSGLTTGAEYYLSDTHGAISTTAGSQSKKVGISVSATKLVRLRDGS